MKHIEAIEHALRVLRATSEPASETTPSAGRLIDLTAFFLALDLAGQMNAEAQQSGLPIASAVQEDYVTDIEAYLIPLFEGYGLKAFAREWEKVKRKTAKTADNYVTRSQFVMRALDRLRTKQALMRQTFTEGRVYAAAKKIADLNDVESPEEKLKALVAIAPVSNASRTRAWIKSAARALNIEVSEFEDALADTSQARDLGARVRELDVQLANSEDAERSAELQQRRDEVVDDISELATQSVNPQATMLAALEAAKPTAATGQVQTVTGKALDLNPQQEVAMVATGKVVIAAGAGSGKTRVLAGRVVYLVKEKSARPASIIATSFTRKSAAELKARINSAAGGTPIITGVADDGFGTTHSISAKLMRRFRPDVVQPYDKDRSFTTVMRIALKQVLMTPTAKVPSAPENDSFFNEKSLARFAPQQEQQTQQQDEDKPPMYFSDALREALTWLTTESADRTRYANQAWVKRFQEKNPSYDVVNSATGLVKGILSKRTKFEDLSEKQRNMVLALFKFIGIGYKPPVIGSVLSAAKQFSNFADRPANQWFNLGPAIASSQTLKEESESPDFTPGGLGRSISVWKGNLVSPSEAWEQSPTLLAAGYAAYEWLKANDPALLGEDGDDLLINFSRLMIADRETLGKLQQRFKHVIVDEAQDLNRSQHLLFGLIAGHYDPNTQKPREDKGTTAESYTLIGDDKQAIYAFRGADPKVFINNSDLRGGDFKTYFIDVNYRSGRKIVDAANHIISHNKDQIPMVCRVGDEQGEGSISAISVETPGDASLKTARLIREGVDSGSDLSYKSYGVLTRTNREAYAYTTALLRSGIPYRSKFNPLKDIGVKSVLNWLLLLKISLDSPVMNEVLVSCLKNMPKFGMSADTFNRKMQELTSSVASTYKGMNFYRALEAGAWRDLYPGNSAIAVKMTKAAKSFWEAVQTAKAKDFDQSKPAVDFVLNEVKDQDGKSLIDQLKAGVKEADEANTMEDREKEMTDAQALEQALQPIAPIIELCGTYPSLTSFLTYVKELKHANEKRGFDDTDKEREIDAVVVDTVHGWKGLEAKHVFVTMAGGAFPDRRSNLEDERRLAYVAITRGQESVTIWCPRTNVFGKPVATSGFISEACLKLQGEDALDKVETAVSGSVDPFDLWEP